MKYLIVVKMICTVALVFIVALCNGCGRRSGNVYSTWSQNGLHLIMSDNGTPNDPEDDWIIDWEDNRSFDITIND